MLMGPDRRENSQLERLATLESRIDNIDRGQIAQSVQLGEIGKTLTAILVQLGKDASQRESIDEAYDELRNLRKSHQELCIRVAMELPDLRNVKKVVYGVLIAMAGSSLAALGLIYAH